MIVALSENFTAVSNGRLRKQAVEAKVVLFAVETY